MKNRKRNLLYRMRWLLLLTVVELTGCGVKKEIPPSPTQAPLPAQTPEITPEPTESPQETEIPEQPVGQAIAATQIYDKIPARTANLKLAIQSVNKTILAPGEEFSFNRTVGDRTKEKGYQEAIGYDENGEKKPTVGGGICQVSSTIYMAALEGDFEITERHSHSHKVPYADSDHDATVSYGGYDFKFKNNRDKPVILFVSMDEESVVAEIREYSPE